MSFIELTIKNGNKILINTKDIMLVKESSFSEDSGIPGFDEVFTDVYKDEDTFWTVKESYEEIKTKLK